ncbi:MAG: hypothetical protein CM15mP77_2880 [Synechococcus sp.]|nr:MAG: hypothetical protein CM15mP77_2880 [Synechococcus sp.]
MACSDSSLPVAFDTETTDLNRSAPNWWASASAGERPWTRCLHPTGPQRQRRQQPGAAALGNRAHRSPSGWQQQPPQGSAERQIRPLDPVAAWRCPEGVVIDTLLADYLRDAAAKHGLELMAEREFGFQPPPSPIWWARSKPSPMCRWSSASPVLRMDVHVTHRLALLLRRQLEAMGPQLLPLLEQVDSRWNQCWPDGVHGIRIDVPYLQRAFRGDGLHTATAGIRRQSGRGWTSTWPHPSSWGSCCSTPLA